jgi:hypothetical protein
VVSIEALPRSSKRAISLCKATPATTISNTDSPIVRQSTARSAGENI